MCISPVPLASRSAAGYSIRRNRNTLALRYNPTAVSMSQQFLQTYCLKNIHMRDVYTTALTSTQLFIGSGSPHIEINSLESRDDNDTNFEPYSHVQTLRNAHPLGCHHICVSLDGTMLASAGFGGEVRTWKPTGEIGVFRTQWKEHAELSDSISKTGEHWALAISENGHFLACTTNGGHVAVYDTQTESRELSQRVARFDTKGSFGMAVDVSSDGEMTASGHQNGGIFIFNNSTQKLAHSLAGHMKAVRAVKFSPACRYLAAAGDAMVISIYDSRSGEQIAILSGHAGWIMTLAWNWNGESLLSGAYDGKVKIWNSERRECVATQSESDHCVWTVGWLPKSSSQKNETFVAAGTSRNVAFYREASGS